MGEDRRPVLAADIRSLSARRGWIVDLPEYVKQLLERDAGRVECHFDHFRMAGLVAADIVVGGAVLRSAQIAHDGSRHAIHMAERRLDTPKTAGSECRLFHIRLPSGVAPFPRLPGYVAPPEGDFQFYLVR